MASVFSELRRLGYVEDGNLIIERYSAEGHHERYADLARQIVASNPDVTDRAELGACGDEIFSLFLQIQR